MFHNGFRSIVVALAAALAVLANAPGAFAQTDQQKLVAAADKTFAKFIADPEMTWLKQNVGRAKAVLIAPNIVKAGFILGGSGGRGAMVARDPNSGKWAGPAFYTLATGSVGFQAGVSASETIVLVMTDRAMNSLQSDSFKLGGDVSIAAGPVGAQAGSNVVADFIAFAYSKGVYAGINLDGTVVTTSDEWNSKYYGSKVMAPDILIRQTVHAKDKGAAKLLADVTKATAKK